MSDELLTVERKKELLKIFRISVRALSLQVVAGDEVGHEFYKSVRRKNIMLKDLDEGADFTSFLQDLITACGARFGFDLPRVEVRWATLAHDNPARVSQRGGAWCVEVDDRHIIDDLRITVAIAHEISHVFLGQKGIRLAPTKKNEELTDITALLAGFGSLMKDVSEVRTTHHGTAVKIESIESMGYLRKSEIDFLLRKRRKIASGTTVRKLAVIPLNEGAHLKCSVCYVAIRVPSRSAKFKVKCPVCSVNHIVRVGPLYAGSVLALKIMEQKFLQPLLSSVDQVREDARERLIKNISSQKHIAELMFFFGLAVLFGIGLGALNKFLISHYRFVVYAMLVLVVLVFLAIIRHLLGGKR